MYTYVRNKELTFAGLRGSRPAQLIEQLGAVNQTAEDVRHLMLTGRLDQEPERRQHYHMIAAVVL